MSDQDYIVIAKLEEENAALRKRVEELGAEILEWKKAWPQHEADLDREIAAVKCWQERAEKAERELDLRKRLMHGLPICGGCMGKYSECQACRADKLQADLNAALDWIEHDEEESIPPAGLWQRINALLEKRREKRG